MSELFAHRWWGNVFLKVRVGQFPLLTGAALAPWRPSHATEFAFHACTTAQIPMHVCTGSNYAPRVVPRSPKQGATLTERWWPGSSK